MSRKHESASRSTNASRPSRASITVPRQSATLEEDAIRLGDSIASVFFGDRALVESKTEDIAGVFEYREGEHASWHLGASDARHCHLALSPLTQVEFSAELAPSQCNHLNYTIWFTSPRRHRQPFRAR